MMRWSLAFALLSAVSAVACIPQAPLEGSSCPCPGALGYTCCPLTNRCVPQAKVDLCGGDTEPPGPDGGSDAGVVGSPFVSVGIGAAHACAVRRDGTIKCVGSNEHGQATPPPGLFYEVTAGEAHTCGVRMVLDDRKQDRTVVCWGDNSHGQLAAPAGPADLITAGARHSCARWTDKVQCWGDNSLGQSTVPAGLSATGDLSAGRNHTCAIAKPAVENGVNVVCWGDNARGQSTPPANGQPVSFLAAGGDHTCASDFGNYLACWGDNDAGQSKEPVGIIRNLSVASGHSCGMPFDASGPIQCWGTDWGTALPVPPTGNFIQVFAGDYLNCAKPANEGSPLVCWGQTYEPWY